MNILNIFRKTTGIVLAKSSEIIRCLQNFLISVGKQLPFIQYSNVNALENYFVIIGFFE